MKTIGLTGLGGLVLAAAIFWMSTGATPPKASSPPSTAAVAAPVVTRQIETSGNSSFIDWLWKSEKPVVVDSGATYMRDDRPDPRAATRVQNFACDANASIGRTLICTHWILATTDYNVTLLYKDALSRSPNPQALSRARRAWLAKLDKQGVDKASILALYEAWRAELTGTRH